MTRQRLSAARLLLRHATTGVGASITVAVVIFVVAALAVGIPRAVQILITDSVQHEVNSLPVTSRDLVAEGFGGPPIGESNLPSESPFEPEADAVWGGFEDALTGIREKMSPALERSLGEVGYAVSLAPNVTAAQWEGAPDTEISLAFDPRMLEHVTIVDGGPPAEMTQEVPSLEPTEIMLSTIIATRMEWGLGEIRTLKTPDGQQPLRLVGTFEARNDSDPYWQHIPASLRPSIEIIGLAPPVVIGVGFANPASWEEIIPLSGGARLNAWFPVKTETLTAANAGEFTAGLREFTRAAHFIGSDLSPEQWFGRYTVRPVTELSFSSRVTNALDDAIATTSATTAVLAMIASGPIGVIVAVLLLGSRLMVDRRSAGIQLAAARGASRRQLRSTLAIEGIALGVPAAAVGALLGAVVVPGRADPASMLLVAVVALLPAVLLASAPTASGMRRVRADLDPRSTGAWRWILEAIVLAAAALSIFLLLRRGLTTTVGQVGVDPLLAAVPLLLSLAACVLVMRLYPIPLAGIVRTARKRPGAVAFLGAARGLRDPAAGLAPILAMVVGVSVAVFSATMLSTVSTGVENSARAAVGADLLVSSQAITAEQAESIAARPEVASTAPVYAEVRGTMVVDGDRGYLTVVVVDAAELRAVQQGAPGSIENLDRLVQGSGGVIPVIASEDVAKRIGAASDPEINTQAIEVVGTAPSEGPMSDRRAWVIIDRVNAQKLIGTIYSPSRIFVDLAADASPENARDGIRSIVQASATVAIPTDVATQLRGNPAVSGLQAALIAALLVISFLCTIAIVMTLARGAASRDRLLTMLRTLGLSRRSESALIAWELAPMTAVALVAGTALGLGLPSIVLAGVDLRLFTGGAQQPAITIDPLLTLVVIGGFLALVLGATATAVATTRRASAATTLRTTEQ